MIIFLLVLLFSGNYLPFHARLPLRIVISAWLLSMVVLINAYAGVLTSFLTVPKLEKVVDTLEQVVEGGKFRVTAEKGTLLTHTFLVM